MGNSLVAGLDCRKCIIVIANAGKRYPGVFLNILQESLREPCNQREIVAVVFRQLLRKLAEESRIVFEENEGYLFSDFWPFIILHFGEKQDRPSPLSVLKTSLRTNMESFYAEECRGYCQGKEAYREWIKGLFLDC